MHDLSKGKPDWRYGEHCLKEGKYCRHPGGATVTDPGHSTDCNDDDECEDIRKYVDNLLFQFYEDGVWELSKVQFFLTSITSIFSFC